MARKLRGLYLRGKTFWLRWTVSGVQHRVSLGTSDPVEAERLALAVRQQPALVGVSSWDNEVEAYLAEQLSRGRLRPRTASNRRYILRAAARGMGIDSPVAVRKSDVLAFYRAKQASCTESAAQSQVMALRAFLCWLCARGSLRDNPADIPLDALPLPRRRWFADMHTVRRLLDECPRDDLRFVLYCGLRAGMRLQEIVEARRFWFAPDSVHVQKTVGRPGEPDWQPKDRDDRTIPLASDFRAWLASWPAFASLSPMDYVLHPDVRHGAAYLRWDPRRPFTDYMRAQRVPLTAHGMRTTFCSLHAQAGTSIYKIAVWTGDRVDVLQRHYAHLAPGHDPAIDATQ